MGLTPIGKNANTNDKDYIEYVKMLELLEIAKEAKLMDEKGYENTKGEIMQTYRVKSNFYLQRDQQEQNKNLGGQA